MIRVLNICEAPVVSSFLDTHFHQILIVKTGTIQWGAILNPQKSELNHALLHILYPLIVAIDIMCNSPTTIYQLVRCKKIFVQSFTVNFPCFNSWNIKPVRVSTSRFGACRSHQPQCILCTRTPHLSPIHITSQYYIFPYHT